MASPPTLRPLPSDVHFPRIPSEGFTAAIFTFLAVAIIGAFGRVGLRMLRFHTFGLDDAFLLLSLVALAATCGVLEQLGTTLYTNILAELHVIPASKDLAVELRFHRLLETASILLWVSLFAAKFSLLVFFRKLVDRVHWLEVWWWIVLGVTVICGGIDIPLGFMVCTDFSDTFLQSCPPQAIAARESVYNYVSTALDILSDLLILTIPLAILWVVKIDLRRKLALAGLSCLSVFQIILAIVRVAAANLPGDVTDTPWLFFWQTLEAAVAVIMVALTGFRSLFRTDGNSTHIKTSGATASNGTATYGPTASHIPLQSRTDVAAEPHTGARHNGYGYDVMASACSMRKSQDSEDLQALPLYNDQGIRVTKQVRQDSQYPRYA